ncbi:hypothetical protein RhiJN_21942 [Ceratobasidium sp. AG-Ba]|nr:hypothetical protein RhiJN_21942 [Ceratobasidium sp. AG-Ba]
MLQMTDKTYSRPTKTTSKTNWERAAIKRIQKQIKDGETPDPLPVRQPPTRDGLRGKLYAYKKNCPPKEVVPRNPEATQPKVPPVPTLEGQEDIPGLEEEHNLLGLDVAAMPGGGVTYYALPKAFTGVNSEDEAEDDLRSNPETVIEEGDSSSSSEDEGDTRIDVPGPSCVISKDKENGFPPTRLAQPQSPTFPLTRVPSPLPVPKDSDLPLAQDGFSYNENEGHPFGPSNLPEDRLINKLSPEEFAFLAANFPHFEAGGHNHMVYNSNGQVGGVLGLDLNGDFAPPSNSAGHPNLEHQPGGFPVAMPLPSNPSVVQPVASPPVSDPSIMSQSLLGEGSFRPLDNFLGDNSVSLADDHVTATHQSQTSPHQTLLWTFYGMLKHLLSPPVFFLTLVLLRPRAQCSTISSMCKHVRVSEPQLLVQACFRPVYRALGRAHLMHKPLALFRRQLKPNPISAHSANTATLSLTPVLFPTRPLLSP